MNIRKPIDERAIIVSVRIPRRLHRKAKQFGRRQKPIEISVSKLVSLALRDYLSRRGVRS